MTREKIILSGLSLVAFFCAGMLTDRLWLTHAPLNETIVHEERATVPVLKIISIGDGYLRGEVTGGEVRVSAGEALGVSDAETGMLAVPLDWALVNYSTESFPEGAQFVASRNGSKYHKLSSSGAQQILPDNRVFFQTEAEAREAGYLPAED